MLKLFCLFSFLVLGAGASTISFAKTDNKMIIQPFDSESQWESHIMDFIQLIDIDALTAAIFQNINDPEVLNFVAFLLGPEFKTLVWEFESIPEFKEAVSHLSEKGYEVERLLNELNSLMQLPPYEKSSREQRSGMMGLIEDILNALPRNDMKKLFEHKMENSPEFAKLFEDLKSQEFSVILERLSKNSKFGEIKQLLEKYGFDFEILCSLAQQILGEHYQGLFCQR